MCVNLFSLIWAEELQADELVSTFSVRKESTLVSLVHIHNTSQWIYLCNVWIQWHIINIFISIHICSFRIFSHSQKCDVTMDVVEWSNLKLWEAVRTNFIDTWIPSVEKFYLNSVKHFWILNSFWKSGSHYSVHCTLSIHVTHQHVELIEIHGKLPISDIWSAALETH